MSHPNDPLVRFFDIGDVCGKGYVSAFVISGNYLENSKMRWAARAFVFVQTEAEVTAEAWTVSSDIRFDQELTVMGVEDREAFFADEATGFVMRHLSQIDRQCRQKMNAPARSTDISTTPLSPDWTREIWLLRLHGLQKEKIVGVKRHLEIFGAKVSAITTKLDDLWIGAAIAVRREAI